MRTLNNKEFDKFKLKIDEAKELGNCTYEIIGKSLGITKQAVAYRIKNCGLADYYGKNSMKQDRINLSLAKLEEMIAANEINGLTLTEIYMKLSARISKKDISSILEKNGIKARTSKDYKHKAIKIKEISEKNGFKFENHTIKEIYEFIIENKLVSELYGIKTLQTELCRNSIEYIRLPRGR